MDDDDKTAQSFDDYFADQTIRLIVSISVFTAVCGIVTNLLNLIFFTKIIKVKKIQSTLWINMVSSYLIKCFAMLYLSYGDMFLLLSDTQEKCRFKYAVPLSIDLACISCYIMLLMERMVALHCHAFYSLLSKITSMVLMYSWSYGISFFLFIMFGVQEYDSPTQCMTPYTHVTPFDPNQFISFVSTCILIMCSLISLLFLYPPNISQVSKIRLHVEMAGTSLVIIYGTVMLLLWIPRQIVIWLFWFTYIDHTSIAIAVKLTSMFLDLTVVVPFFALLSRPEFRTFIYCLFTYNSLEPLKRKLIAKENYISTIRKLVEYERKSSALKYKYRQASISVRSQSKSIPLPPVVETVSTPSPLEARNEFYLMKDCNDEQGTEV